MNTELKTIIAGLLHPTPTTIELHGVEVQIQFEDSFFTLMCGDRTFASICTSGELEDYNDTVIPAPTMFRIIADVVEALAS